LVEIVGFFEAGEVAGEEGWAGEDGGGEELVGFAWGFGGGDGWVGVARLLSWG